ncbi:MAG: trigger factor [Alphaproteobacteria bacterium]
MQVTEITTEGLKREFAILVPRADLDAKVDGKLAEIKDKVQLKGFRPGKVPLAHLKKTYGKGVMGEVVEEAVNEATQAAVAERKLRAAQPPRIELTAKADDLVAGKTDLTFNVTVDVMPEFTPVDPATLSLTRLTAEVPAEDIEKALGRMADQQRTFTAKEEGAAAATGDQLKIDFEGKIDGVPFDGGKAEDFMLVLGSGMFIPGFEDQLVGAKAGDEKAVNVTFPEAYGSAELAGKAAVFDVKVKEVRGADAVEIDDAFAAKMGIESLDKLKELISAQMGADYARASRSHIKRALLDALDKAHDFPLPEGMVEAEFDAIWKAVLGELEREKKTFEDEGKSEDELKAEYRKIAERRVRLGLVLAEIGRLNSLDLTQEELGRAVAAEARRYPGQEQQVFEFYQKNPQALAQLRAPLYEDKVVDFIVAMAKVEDKTVSREELFKEPEGDDPA